MKFQILFLFALFVLINGFPIGSRKVRQVDSVTAQLEDKLLRSPLQTFNGRAFNSPVSVAQNEQVAYGIDSTFVFKVQAGTGPNVRVSPANNQPRVNVPQTRSSLERE